MTRLDGPALRPRLWALAGLLLAVACGPGQQPALPAPPAPVAWPADNPYPEQSARRRARLAELRDPANDEPAALLVQYLDDRYWTTRMGWDVFEAMSAALEAGDPATAAALAQSAVERPHGTTRPMMIALFGQASTPAVEHYLSLLYDYAEPLALESPTYAAGWMEDYAATGRLEELPHFVAGLLEGGQEMGSILRGHLALALAHEEMGDTDSALSYAAAALAVQLPRDGRVAGLTEEEVELARMLLRLDRKAEALAMLEAAYERLSTGPGLSLYRHWQPTTNSLATLTMMELFAQAGEEHRVWRIRARVSGCGDGSFGGFCRLGLKFVGDYSPDRDMATIAIARGRARRGDLEGAMEATARLHNEDAVLALQVVAPAFLDAGDPRGSSLVNSLVAHADTASMRLRTNGRYGRGYLETVDTAIAALAQAGHHEAALAVVAADGGGYLGRVSEGTVLSWAVADGAGRKALRLALGIKDAGRRDSAVLRLAYSVDWYPDSWDLSTLEEFVGLIEGRDQATLPPLSYITLGVALAEHGQIDKAHRLLEKAGQMRDPISRPISRHLVAGFARLLSLVGDKSEARTLLVAAHQAAPVEGFTPTDALTGLLARLIRNGVGADKEVLERVAELRALDPPCARWQRVGEMVEALRFCDSGAWERRGVQSLVFVGPGRLARLSSDGALEIWDLAGEPVLTATLPAVGEVTRLAADPESGRLAVGNPLGLLAIGDTRTGDWLRVSEDGPGVLGLEYIAGGTLAVLHPRGGVSLALRGSLAPEELFGPSTAQTRSEGPAVVALDPDRLRSVVSFFGRIHLLSGTPGTPGYHRTVGGNMVDMGFLPGGERLLALEPDGSIGLWDVATFTPLRAYRTLGEARKISLAADGGGFATVASGELQLWGLDASEPYHRQRPGAGAGSLSFAFSPDGQSIFVADTNGVGYILSREGGLLAGPLWGHRMEVNEPRWSPDSRFVATSSLDGTVIWRLLPAIPDPPFPPPPAPATDPAP